MGYRIQYSDPRRGKSRGVRLLPAALLLLALLYRFALASDHQAGLFTEIENAFQSLDSLVFQIKNDVLSKSEHTFRQYDNFCSNNPE